jgi:cobalt-zinc-cadmium efflux system outer membrane protein
MRRACPIVRTLSSLRKRPFLGCPRHRRRGSSALTWEQVKAKFEAANPVLKSDQSNVDEMKAEEITAYLRPNPQFTMTGRWDLRSLRTTAVYQPFKGTDLSPNFSYLHERDHKRELRLQSAQQRHLRLPPPSTRTWTRNDALRAALGVCRDAGGQGGAGAWPRPIWSTTTRSSTSARPVPGRRSGADRLDRIELLRVQYESEIQTAIVNLRTSKIALLQLLDDRTPVDQFDVTGRSTSQRPEAAGPTLSRRRWMRVPTCAPP